jgi:hypothetical protein
MDFGIFSLGWAGLIIGIFVVVSSGVLYFVLRNKIAEYPSLKEYKEAKLKLPQVNASLQLNEESLKNIRTELASLEVQNEKNKAEKEDFLKWEQEIKDKYATLDAQASSIDKLMKRRTEALEKVMEQEKLLNQRTVQLQEAEKQLQEKTEEIDKLDAKKKELDGIALKLQAHQKELDILLQKLTETKDDVKSLESTKDALIKSNAQMGAEKTTLEESLKALKKEQEKLEKTRDSLADGLAEMKDKSAKISKSLKELEDSEKKSEKLAAEKKAEVETYDKQLEKLRREDATLDGEIKRKKDVLRGYNEDISKREKELAEVMTQLKESIDKLGDAFKAADNMVEAMVDASGAKLPNVEERLEDWSRPYFTLTKALQKEGKGEDAALLNFKKHIKASGFRFDDRVLDSFHTSLKVSGFSPLTVLAGISGTGKSQLPRLYCEAMGINFLPVSVQPRWDSPQDLLGFYNYVENRYKATPVSRALRQFDGYNEGKDSGNLKDQMLMVLLDEMNLARVEYYFSDFLSKLENRDRKREHDPKARADSELFIEAGPLTDKDSKKFKARLYPGFNILFVGTMNEDDTTQTLSDKVLDRSNVLRFGRPGQLEVAVSSESQNTSGQALPFKYWESWIKDPIPRTSPWAVRLDELNENLERVGRPFGHRVFGGILTYLGNYPDQTEQGLKNAFADQIEVKILPKLRGLETRTAANPKVDSLMNTVAKLIDDTGSLELEEAFNMSKGEDFFSFVGVRR